MIATFDTSTLENTFSDPGFIAFVEANTTLNNGTRTINQTNSCRRDRWRNFKRY